MKVLRDNLNLAIEPSSAVLVTFPAVHLGSVPSDQQSAVHHHHLPRHVAGGLGCQKQDDVGDLFRLADPAHRNEIASRLRALRARASAPRDRSCAVRMYPGATPLTRTPSLASSTASPRTRPTTPALAEE